ncbi:muts-like protein 2-like protein [Thamnocephalis sphaerospora]|uniref:Muts-like protein 2-like protein n=1 Tax=Thamnocephalis sphaerospora TaxID=78915 RepID=A0A4P9XYF5_9FUNG|nr:muts-like protein 2-like protein [Thamnocephalis sphaerospora]|eukprot:RKP10741.1 muts-like protein 2-like protein [Thamnocephalis sphaerospora]
MEKPVLELDNTAAQGFCQAYRRLPEKPSNTVRLFERNGGEFYSVHGDDALYVAHNVYKTTGVLKYFGGSVATGIPSCTLSRATVDTFLREALTVRQQRVEIWATESKKSNAWFMSKQARASPGNIQALEDMIFSGADVLSPPMVAALWLSKEGDQHKVGVCFADTTLRTLGVCEFIDSIMFANVEALVIQLGVKECILPASEAGRNYELDKLRGVLDRAGVLVTDCMRSLFRSNSIEQDLRRLLGEEAYTGVAREMNMKSALASAGCVIKYLDLLSDESNFGHYVLRRHELSQFMRLDTAAVRALNLMPTAQDGNNTALSVFGLLNRCRTAQGSRLLGEWLMQPLLSIAEIDERHALVEMFTENAEFRQTLQDVFLKRMPDLHRLSKRLQRGSATLQASRRRLGCRHLQDVVRIYQVLALLPDLLNALKTVECVSDVHTSLVKHTYANNLEKYDEQLYKLREMIELTIDLEKADHHQYVIRASFDNSLQEHDEVLETTMQEMQNHFRKQRGHRQVSRSLQMEEDKKIKLEKSNLYGYCIREASRLRDSGLDYAELTTQKAGLYFTTPELKQLNETYTTTQEEYQRVQSSLVKEVLGIVASYCPVMETLNGLLAHLDVITSFAYVAVHSPAPYVRPTMHAKGEGVVILRDARHPCLEALDGVSVIPNDVELRRGERELLIVTGPNMGGKSTYIRQIGVIALMAQVGSFVPCREATLTVFDAILARVGAGDSQLKGVSTFMAEMLETATILRAATEHSLIIVDELGRGTSTYDGFGLAWAISEYIATKVRCCCVFATHFHELTQLAERVGTVKNMHVLAHTEGTGICDQSFGIHVAELANFPPLVVQPKSARDIELQSTAEQKMLAKLRALGACSDIGSLPDSEVVSRLQLVLKE